MIKLNKEEYDILDKLFTEFIEQIDTLRTRIKILEERKSETHIHNHYHNETPTYWPPVKLKDGTGDLWKPPFEVTCGVAAHGA